MKDYSIDIEELKSLMYSKKTYNNVITKKLFGITIKYVRGSCYDDYIQLLKYIEPYVSISNKDLINEFEDKSKCKHISAEVYLSDKQRFNNIHKSFDPSILPPATGTIRTIQLNTLNFSKEIISDIEKNTDLKPFMDDGTLLGAIRHKGFIPWDDDIDFSLMRKDYIKLEKYLRNRYISIDTSEWSRKTFETKLQATFGEYPNETFVLKRNTSIKVFNGTYSNQKVCDFFALDYYDNYTGIETLKQYIKQIKNKVYANENIKFSKIFDIYNAELQDDENIIVEESDTIQAGIDNYDFYWYSPKGMRRKADVFPLQKIKFEDTEFWAPNNPHEYLKTLYSSYNTLPNTIAVGSHNLNSCEITLSNK